MDILFLYRTPKKKRYFHSVVKNCFTHLDAQVVGYYSLMLNPAFLLPLKKELLPALNRSVEEVFRSRSFFGSSFLKLVFKIIMSCKIKCLHRGLQSYFKKSSPKNLVIWNGLKHADMVLNVVLKDHPKIKTFFMENGFLPKTTFIDKKGINAGSSLSKDKTDYIRHELKSFPNYDHIEGREAVRKSSAANAINKSYHDYVLLPFQMERDSQILDYSPWIQNMNQLFNEVRASHKSSNLCDNALIVREHPSTKVSYPKLYKQSSDTLIFDHKTPFSEALDNASVIVTINSSVGFEGILKNKAVIVLGKAFYDIKGLCLTATNQEELTQALNDSTSFSIDQDLKRHFISYLYNDFLIQGDWKTPNEEHFKSFKKRFKSL